MASGADGERTMMPDVVPLRVVAHASVLHDHWWREPFKMAAPVSGDVQQVKSLSEPKVLGRLLPPNLRADVFIGTNAKRVRRQRRRLHRAISRNLAGETPSYALAVLTPRRHHALLAAAALHEPRSLMRRKLPEAECDGATRPANRTVELETALRWRMLAISGAAGAGMALHVDDPPLSSWHTHVRGAKHWLLCPTHAIDNRTCRVATLRAGESIYYPHGWWHQTRSIERWTTSISRSLITPANARGVALGIRRFCEEASALGTHVALCRAMRPCLLRLARVRDDDG